MTAPVQSIKEDTPPIVRNCFHQLQRNNVIFLFKLPDYGGYLSIPLLIE